MEQQNGAAAKGAAATEEAAILMGSNRGFNSYVSSNHMSSSHGAAAIEAAACGTVTNSDPMELQKCAILHLFFFSYTDRNSDLPIINVELLF
jgi:hypothetical protein